MSVSWDTDAARATDAGQWRNTCRWRVALDVIHATSLIAANRTHFISHKLPCSVDFSTANRSTGGATPKFLAWTKCAADDRRSTSDLWPISHNTGIGEWDKQKSLCDVCTI